MFIDVLQGMMATSLRTGEPLPQITPCPLLDRFLLKYHGFNVIHKEAEEDFGLPRSLTIETLEDEQYQYVTKRACRIGKTNTVLGCSVLQRRLRLPLSADWIG